MRVSFSAEPLEEESAWLHLDQIIYEVARGVHDWHVDDPERIERSAWLRGARGTIRTLLERAALSTRYRAPDQLHRLLLLVGTDAPPQSLSPEKAVQFLRTPLKVLMENRLTDGVLLDAVFAVLASEEVRRLKEEAKAIAYDSPGGNGELKKLVRDLQVAAQRVGMPLRVVVFTDSDGRRAGEVSSKAQEIERECKKWGIPCVVLQKRSIENYVPDEAISEWRDEPAQTNSRPRIEALLRLTGEQRDHFPMKHGLKWTPEDIELYRAGVRQPPLSPEDARLLERGFERFIHILFTTDANGNRRPRASLTAEALRRRDDRGDLDKIMNHILELL